jgi:Na+/phosphate symporter
MTEQKQLKSELTMHWAMAGIMLSILIIYNIICHIMGAEMQINLAEEDRIFIRTIFYVVAIALFPFSTLLRHILLRLNHTMPGDNPAKNRYLMTTIVTLISIEIVGIFGFVMFFLGDGYNTLYIFTALGTLGIFLHRPREQEYRKIIEALEIPNE